ncbi:hypothetical protein ANN_17458 [Periplaneta americana]|uniref:Transposable element Tcb1 transposase n=1 Tax=Periplaneta americana TaxID=6978 RepID=A0ABQ8ST09_PERAM|nr:hypothetical protein ANN_17458 [Periplaneta americana]
MAGLCKTNTRHFYSLQSVTSAKFRDLKLNHRATFKNTTPTSLRLDSKSGARSAYLIKSLSGSDRMGLLNMQMHFDKAVYIGNRQSVQCAQVTVQCHKLAKSHAFLINLHETGAQFENPFLSRGLLVPCSHISKSGVSYKAQISVHLKDYKGICAYLSILKNNVKESAVKLGLGPSYYFQQDNDPKHTAHILQMWLLHNTPRRLQIPPQSPDLNPIENLEKKRQKPKKSELK